MAGIQLSTVPNSSRVHRRPRHKFKCFTYPYCLTPFMISAVWPGESLVNAWFEAREVSPPLVDPITGWGSEWYLFYVKMSDLTNFPQVMDMLINPTNAPLTGAGSNFDSMQEYYHVGPFPNYSFICAQRVVETYFRDTGESAYSSAPSQRGPYYKVKFRDHALYDSLTQSTFDDSVVTPPVADGMDDLARAQDLYDYLVAAQLTDMSYSDWCAAYGVKIPKSELNEPELLVKFSEWSYPSNTVDPATGSPSTALSLVVKKSFNEPRYFKEPGFLVGYHVLRPKIYVQEQLTNGVDYLNTALAWLPAMLNSDPATSLREFTNDQIIRGGSAATKSILDMRDVPVYGDQFTNYDPAQAALATFVNFSTTYDDLSSLQYPLDADLDALFKTPTINKTDIDGFINLDIVGRIVDYTTSGTSSG